MLGEFYGLPWWDQGPRGETVCRGLADLTPHVLGGTVAMPYRKALNSSLAYLASGANLHSRVTGVECAMRDTTCRPFMAVNGNRLVVMLPQSTGAIYGLDLLPVFAYRPWHRAWGRTS